MKSHQPIVVALQKLLNDRPDLLTALHASIVAAARRDIGDVAQYYDYLDQMVCMIPTDRDLNRHINKFFYLMDLSPADLLRVDTEFQAWVHQFCLQWGAFLDTPASASGVHGFFGNPDYHMDDYYVAPSGWLTFNQFFARQVKPGRRPIDGLCDHHTVVCPADSVYQGQWPITGASTIEVKGFTWSIMDLLHGSPYQEKFVGGVFTHGFLNVNDYHRFHVPLGGTVLEARKVSGRVMMDVVQLPDGTLDAVDGTGYQFTQDRGLLVLDTSLGLVAVLPIGMAQVSSVTLTAEVGAQLFKGQEFGFFQFGGSDIVMLFEAGKVELTAVVGQHYNQGKRVGQRTVTHRN